MLMISSQMVTRHRVLDLTHVVVFVLDEADNMLEQGTMAEQSIQVKRCDHPVEVRNETDDFHSLIAKFSKQAQIILFSATFAGPVGAFAAKFAPAANEIRLKTEELSIEGIKQFFMGSFALSRVWIGADA